MGCRIDRSQQWAVRCTHEASLYDHNTFITLTYNNENLPEDGSLQKRDWQLFMKRLRKYYSPKKIRFYMCGEYGTEYRRPHYHACLFNHWFDDQKLYKNNRTGDPLYTSEILTDIWGKGMTTHGPFTYATAAYVSRYIMKKRGGAEAATHYCKMDQKTGEVYQIEPEFTLMSRMPGIGQNWFDQFQSDVFPCDFVVVDGRKKKVPLFYTNQLKKDDETEYLKIRGRRVRAAEKHADNNTPERRKVREKVLEARTKNLKRELE